MSEVIIDLKRLLLILVTWNHIIVNKLLVLDKNTLNHITAYELFVLRIVTWNYNCLQIIIISYL